MMHCFPVGCNRGSRGSHQKCKFFRFPSDQRKRVIWMTNCRRGDREPSHNDRLCSCHFIDQDRNNNPSIFSFNATKQFKFSNPPGKKRRLRKDTSDSAQPS